MTIEKPITYDTWRFIKEYNLDGSMTNVDGPDHYVFEGLIYTPYIPSQILNEPPIWDHGAGELEELPQHWLDPDNGWTISSRGLRRRLLIDDFFIPVRPLGSPAGRLYFLDDNFTLEYNKWEIKKPMTFKTWRLKSSIETIYITMNVNPYVTLTDIEPE